MKPEEKIKLLEKACQKLNLITLEQKKEIDELKAEIEQIKTEKGAEAEALRVAFEQMSKRRDDFIEPSEIAIVLERIDAHDSLKYLESKR